MTFRTFIMSVIVLGTMMVIISPTVLAVGSCGNGSGGNTSFPNPLCVDTVEAVLSGVLTRIRTVIVVLALVFILVGAVLYVTSGGNDGQIKLAKGAIFAALVGLAIGIAAPSFLREIYDVLQPGTVITVPDEVKQAKTLSEIGLNVVNFLLGVTGVLALIMLIYGGITYFTAGIDPEQEKSAKKILQYSIVGIVIALASLLAVKQLASLFV